MLQDYPVGKGGVRRPENSLGSAADPLDAEISWEGCAEIFMEKVFRNFLERKKHTGKTGIGWKCHPSIFKTLQHSRCFLEEWFPALCGIRGAESPPLGIKIPQIPVFPQDGILLGAVGAYDWNGAVLKETSSGKVIPLRESYLQEFPEELKNHGAYLGGET